MSGICAGTPLCAANGFQAMEAQATYYFLRSSPQREVVSMVRFVERPRKEVVYKSSTKPRRLITPQPLPVLVRMPRSDFEFGIRHGYIQVGECALVPPWLKGLEGINLDLAEDGRSSPVRLHGDRVDDKLFAIAGLLANLERILDADDPDIAINRHARTLRPVRNETRVRLWFYVYLAFGRNRNSLHYPVHQIGHWDRMAIASAVKRGAPHSRGAQFGYNTTRAMLEKIESAYRREAGLGASDAAIYRAAMRKHFGCKPRWVNDGTRKYMELYHPAGEAFPQMGAFFYHVDVTFGRRNVQATRMGRNVARSKIQPVLGSFTEATWNLMQRVEADAYRVDEVPRGYVDKSDIPSLVVVTRRDTASGMKTGVGFGQGSEDAAAYRMALFCEAVNKVRYCALYGVVIGEEQWPSQGVSPADIVDRGPGSTARALSRDASLRPVVREGAPAHAGQSKAIVETSHPKTLSNDDAPSFVRSNLTSIQLVRREIWKLLAFNESCHVDSRVDPDIADRVSRSSPIGIWNALHSLGRNDAVQCSFDDAVRAYLDIVSATLRRTGVEMVGRNYYSRTPEFESALSSVPGDQTLDVKVYVLKACVRHIWMEWNRQLIQLDVRYPVPVNDDVKYMSFSEAFEYHEQTKNRGRGFKSQHQHAVHVRTATEYEEQTGLPWDGGTRVSGRPKRGGSTARQEAREAAIAASGRGPTTGKTK